MKDFNWKSYLPHAGMVLFFMLLTMIYFNPLLSGKAIKQGDVEHFKGMSKEIADYRSNTGKEPLWTGHMFSGMPAFQISTLYPSNWVKPLIAITSMGIPHPACIIFLCMFGFYLLLLSFRTGNLLAAAGAVAFGFSSYFIILIEAGHNPKGYAIAYMAPVVMGILMCYRGKLWSGAAITAISLALELAANHLQITYYLAILCLFLVLGEFIRAIAEKQIASFLKSSGLLVVAALLAVLPNITNLLVTAEYSKYTIRGESELSSDKANKTSGLDRDYATQWSYGKGETFTLMLPNFKGGESQSIGENEKALKDINPDMREMVGQYTDQYWGEQPFTSGPVYVGAIVCFLFVLGMFIIKDTVKWYLLAATVLSILLSWGKNFPALTDFFMDIVPGYNKFRAVSMTLVIAEFTIPLVAILAIKEFVQNPNILRNQRNQFFIAVASTAGLCLLFYLMPTLFQDFYKAGEYDNFSQQLKKSNFDGAQANAFLSGMEAARMAIFKADALRSFFFIILGAGLLWIYNLKQFNKNYLFAALGLLILIDLWAVDKRYLSDKNFVAKSMMDTPYQKTAADEKILADPDPNYRVANTTVGMFNDAGTSYFHKSIGGYHGAKLRRYQDLYDAQITKNNMQIFHMLNTKYFIVQNKQSGELDAMPNPMALGNAWFVKQIAWVANPDEELKALTNFDPKTVAITDKKWQKEIGTFAFDSMATIKLTSYQPNELKYLFKAGKAQFTVFSEIYYPKGWNAYIDGKLTPHQSVNYVLRAMVLPAGQHEVVFKFEPETYYKGEKIAMAGSLLLFLFVIAGFVLQSRQNNHSQFNIQEQ